MAEPGPARSPGPGRPATVVFPIPADSDNVANEPARVCGPAVRVDNKLNHANEPAHVCGSAVPWCRCRDAVGRLLGQALVTVTRQVQGTSLVQAPGRPAAALESESESLRSAGMMIACQALSAMDSASPI